MWGTLRMASRVVRLNIRKIPSATSATCGQNPIPNQRMNNGIRAKNGTGRTRLSRVASKKRRTKGL